MRQHVSIIGWLFIAFGAFAVFSLIVGGVILLVGGASVLHELDSLDKDAMMPMTIFGVVLLGALVFGIVISALEILAGVGLLKLRPWGRILAIVMGIFALPSIPLGTALGIYTLIIMFNQETIALFARRPAPPTSSHNNGSADSNSSPTIL